MPPSIKKQDRLLFINTLRNMDDNWSTIFGEAFYQLHYSELFTKMWAQNNQPLPRSDAYRLMSHLSEQTAKKYINHAIQVGFIEQIPNPEDGRSQLLQLSKDAVKRLEKWIDGAIRGFRKL